MDFFQPIPINDNYLLYMADTDQTTDNFKLSLIKTCSLCTPEARMLRAKMNNLVPKAPTKTNLTSPVQQIQTAPTL